MNIDQTEKMGICLMSRRAMLNSNNGQPDAAARARSENTARPVAMLDSMSKEQFDAVMQKGYDEAQAGIGLSVDEAFKKIQEVI